MTIDTTGTWWTGTEFADLSEYLQALTKTTYPASEVRQSVCRCRQTVFALHADRMEGCAQRTCCSCGDRAYLVDSADSADEARLRPVKCPCGGKKFEIGVGFSFRENGEVRWITIGQRCVACGVLASYADWSIDYAPSRQLLQQV
jgi:hypothetical protein